MGGDYYDIFAFGDKKRYGILLADSQTHGMASALLSVLVKLRLEEMKEKFPDSKSFVEFLNHEIQLVHQKELASLSLLYGILDRSSLNFQYTVAGNLRPLLWRLGEAPPLTTPTNPNLGGVDNYNFKEGILSLKPSDLLIFYTDGLDKPLSQATGQTESSEVTTHDKLISILSHRDPSPDPLELQNDLMALVDQLQDNHGLSDDLTLIQLEVQSNALYVASESK